MGADMLTMIVSIFPQTVPAKSVFLLFSCSWYDCSVNDDPLQSGYRMATAQRKQGIWCLLFPDKESTGNFFVTRGKFLWCREKFWTVFINAKGMFLFTYFCFAGHNIWLQMIVICTIFLVYLLSNFVPISHLLQVSTKLIETVLETHWNNVI